MSALVQKEIRLVWPAWVAALCLAVLPPHLSEYGPDTWRVWLFFFGLGAVILSALPLGRELSLGTFSNLLAQPVERRRLWRVKFSVLAVALGSVWAGFVLFSPMRAFQWAEAATWDEVSALAGLLALLAFSGGLWTTLLLRHTVASILVTVMTPLIISMAILGALDRYPPPTAIETSYGVLVLYAILAIVWARKLFLRAQDTQWTGGTIALPAWRRRGATSSTESKPPSGPLRALVGKELQLHQATLLVAGVLAGVHLGAIAALKLGVIGPGSNFRGAVEGFWMLWLALPLMAGSSAVAEERRLGTQEAHLCLPVSRRRQCRLKFSVVLALGVLLGAAVPWLLEGLRTGAGVGAETGEGPLGWPMLAGLAAASTLIALLSFYASSLTRNTVEALGTSALMMLGGFVVVGLLADGLRPFFGFPLWSAPLVAIIGWPVMLLTVAWLAPRNFQHLRPGGGVWLRDFLTLAAALVVTMALSTALYFRAWEWLTPAESGHGAARIPRSGNCRLESGGVRTLAVLLPDGRLWLGQWTWRHGGWLLPARLISPGTADGRFVTTSNWTGFAATLTNCVGLRRDGSLWDLSDFTSRPTATPRESDRIGHDNDWKTVTAGFNHFLALRKDGTLWWWGQSGATAALAPQRIGTNSDWFSIHAFGGAIFALKTDGSAWRGWMTELVPDSRFERRARWGVLPSPAIRAQPKVAESAEPKGPEQDVRRYAMGAFGEPGARPPSLERWPDFSGPDFVRVTGNGPFAVALRSDGSLWTWGEVPRELLRRNWPGGIGFTNPPLARIGSEADWADASASEGGFEISATKRDGSLWRWDRPPFPDGSAHRNLLALHELSRHHDWVAVDRFFVVGTLALAADGGLWLWPEYSFDANALLRPSRRPHQIANIFE